MPTRVFIEGTSTYIDRQVGGIHRVVRRIVEEMRFLHDELDIESAPVVLSSGQLRDASSIVSAPASAASNGGLRRVWNGVARQISFSGSIDWSDTDLLLLMDASWGKRIWPAVRKAKQRGVRVGVMVHDLIPIHYPQFFPRKLPRMFRRWLDGAIQHADFFVCNSETTLRDLQRYLQGHTQLERVGGGRPGVQFGAFSLGADVANTDCGAAVRDDVRSFFTDRAAPYLLVATIEPRKNHTYLLDAFDRVWQHFPDARLGLVGKIGWRCQGVLSRIREHPKCGESLMLFSDLSDSDLQFCYRHSKAFVFPSIVEGYGLPIVEALNHRLRVLAGDTPIHREVGKRHCQYFDLGDSSSLATMILEMERAACQDGLPDRPYRPVTWEESCRELLTQCLSMAGIARAEQSGEGPSSHVLRLKPAA